MEKIKCSVCDNEFVPKDEMDFICGDCQKFLVGHCGCGNDDVQMDWGVADSPDFAYYWVIECICGHTKQSRLFNISDFDVVAKEVHGEWIQKCPECDSQITDDQYCMMGHWCGTPVVPVVEGT